MAASVVTGLPSYLMAITIVATVGSASANSFASEAEQIAYMAGRLNLGAWTTITGASVTPDEAIAMVEATREVSRMTYKGNRADSTQALDWPRQLVHDPDSPSLQFFETTEVPQRVKDATMELAFQFIKAGTTDVASVPSTDGIRRSRIGVLETEYFELSQRTGLRRYPRVWESLAPLLAHSSSLTAPLVKG